MAIKQIKCGDHGEKSRMIADFANEVELMATLRHPHICLFMGAIVRFPRLCIVTELCHRGSLYHILHANRDKPLRWSLRVRMAQEAAAAIQVQRRALPQTLSYRVCADALWGFSFFTRTSRASHTSTSSRPTC